MKMEEIYDVIIVGGALAGSRTAGLIAKNGRKVLLIEEHENIGVPCKCTGLVSWRTPEILKNLPKKLIVNKLDTGKFNAPDGTSFVLKSKKVAYVLDRTGLDKFLFDQAIKSGVEVRTEHFEDFQYVDDNVEVRTNKGSHKTKILIGADGANSIVAEKANLEMPKNIFVGLQTTAAGNFQQHAELWFGRNTAPNFFAWVVPENNELARIGVSTPSSPKPYYERFLEARLGHNGLKPDVAGIIRYGIMKDTVNDRVMLVGDAACQVKPFSGGGITYGLIAAQICADAVEKAFEENRFDYDFFKKHYDTEWKNKLLPGIRKGLLLRTVLYNLPDFHVNLLFKGIKLFGNNILSNFDFDLLSG
ncbi:MAG: NAD(P)/FAD-dependent oxidoreductase [Candidatus Aenigmarchaeota archaeon]|nr:NAD(P)/FAD-dependent oxidoreductase [Candidatus Aenigmarchaeota archaeon]